MKNSITQFRIKQESLILSRKRQILGSFDLSEMEL